MRPVLRIKAVSDTFVLIYVVCNSVINSWSVLKISADMGSKALRASDKSCLSSISKMATLSRLTGSLKAIKVKRGIKLLKPLLPFVDCSCLLVTAFASMFTLI